MAEMIPDRLPVGRASAGEEQIFKLLKGLDDDCIVYYEPVVSDRYPDFVVIIPDLGLLVIEVKGWWPRWIVAADNNNVQINNRGVIENCDHPVWQAKKYKFDIMNCCKADDYLSSLLCHVAGEYQGKFKFPFGHVAYLHNINSQQLEELGLQAVFPEERVITKDRLESWQGLSGQQLRDKLKPFFTPFDLRSTLSEQEVNAIRAIIHPEIIIQRGTLAEGKDDDSMPAESSLKLLDLQQEQHARKIKGGHRIINGVAGSGKTVMLIARGKLLAQRNDEVKVLVLCYNRALASYLRSCLSDCPSIQALHFHDWAINNNGVAWHKGVKDSDFGKKLLTVLENGYGESRLYDAILIDEAQDFAPEWFQCVREALKEPDDGDLVIVADGNQGLYRPELFTWKSVGVKAPGRVIKLETAYRSTREIMELASIFAEQDDGNDADKIPKLKARQVVRSGAKPLVIKASSRTEEHKLVVELVAGLMQGKWGAESIPRPLKPSEIGIIYPRLMPPMSHSFDQFRRSLASATESPVIWLTNRGDPDAMAKLGDPGIKIVTIHSAKGLQFRAVIFLWADLLPKTFGEVDIPADKKLMYVGLTRPEEFLAVTYSGGSEFTKLLERLGTQSFAL